MQVSKSIILLALTFAVAAALPAQSTFDITMPSVEAPTIGNGHYRPSSTNRRRPSENVQSNEQSSSEVKTKKTSISQALTEESATQTSLSAKDVQSLGSMGLLANLSSMFSTRNSLDETVLPNVSSLSSNNEETNELLKKILSAMEDLKKENQEPAALTAIEQNVALTDAEADAAKTAEVQKATRRSHMLRFMINGYNVLQTCRTIYISDMQEDGSFLVTGDRKYMSDGKARTETFHLLFKAQEKDTSAGSYSSAAQVTQDSLNPNSFLYQLSQKKNLTASRTGSLVSMRTDEKDWKLELLIDLGEKR